jgi:hypothetical protein
MVAHIRLKSPLFNVLETFLRNSVTHTGRPSALDQYNIPSGNQLLQELAEDGQTKTIKGWRCGNGERGEESG